MKKVLIIDDDPDILESISLVLRYSGFEPKTKENIEDLPDVIKAFNPDIILLDIFLGTADGTEVCKNLKNYPPTQNIPVLMISAHAKAAEVMQNCPANGFLAKPFDIDELVTQLNRLIANN